MVNLKKMNTEEKIKLKNAAFWISIIVTFDVIVEILIWHIFYLYYNKLDFQYKHSFNILSFYFTVSISLSAIFGLKVFRPLMNSQVEIINFAYDKIEELEKLLEERDKKIEEQEKLLENKIDVYERNLKTIQDCPDY